MEFFFINTAVIPMLSLAAAAAILEFTPYQPVPSELQVVAVQ